jgi:uncharacterized membrane protein YphA (DoxX/SURF4 family)
MKRATIVEIIALLFAILFLYTGISKLLEYTVFKEQIAASPVLAPVAKWIAAGLPLAELLVAVLLFIPRWRLKGLYTSFILMILFTGYIIAILNFSKYIPCSCGGVLAQLSWSQHIVFNSVFIILAIVGIALEKRMERERRIGWGSLANK